LNIRVLVLTGEGLNCEKETSYAFEVAGAEPVIMHIRDLFQNPAKLRNYQILAFIGGFSHGDHLGAGSVLAHQVGLYLREEIERFLDHDHLMIGICNGFQVLARTGILPGMSSPWQPRASLISNDRGTFENRWVHLGVHPDSRCLWTAGLEELFLPVRHGEGKFFTPDENLLVELEEKGRVVLQYLSPDTKKPTMEYPHNPNGSQNSIAAITNEKGTILGMMPHPEAYLSTWQHPQYTRHKVNGNLDQLQPRGTVLFENAVSLLKGR